MTSYNRSTAPSAMIAFSKSKLARIPYSEQSPNGSDGDGHLWVPGDADPDAADCSGSEIMTLRFVGITVSNNNAQELLEEFADVRIGSNEPLQPGDQGAFLGSPYQPGIANHTSMVLTINNATGLGTIIGEQDTALGWAIVPFNRHQTSNENGLGVVGFYRPVNRLPVAPPPPKPPVPPPAKQNPLAEAYAKAHGMVIIDYAEAELAVKNHPEIAWYTWDDNKMVGHSIAQITQGVYIYAFASILNQYDIPHAGA